MDSGLAISSPKAYSVTTGGNLWRSKHSTKNIYYARLMGSYSTVPKTCTHFGDEFCENVHAMALLDIGSVWTLCAFSSSLLAVEKLSDISLSFFIGVLQAVLPQLFIEIYLSGVNQLYDLEIDKINKPHLPIASGQFSFKTGVIVSASFLALSVGFTWITGSWPLIWNLIVISSTWTAYSIDVPLLRWKRYPLVAAMCMVSTWAFALPISFFHHMQTVVLKRPISFPRSLTFVVAFMTFYSMGLALSKDIPDVEGDKEHGINSLSVRLGQKRVFWICVFLFEMAFGVGLLAGASSSYLHTKIVTGLGNVVLASILLYQAKSVDLNNKASTGFFYMFIWKLLYAAFFLMALIR
ncbi:Glycinol 4-dimethylallyltransferase [Glycine max]|nr:Glycinol 4-dimethylallyltransferase [Glycine max]